MRLLLVLLIAFALFAGCGDKLPVNASPCDTVYCSGHGECALGPDFQPTCVCEAGYRARDLSCVESCEGVDCSGHGVCRDLWGQLSCLCDDEYEAVSLSCVAVVPGGDGGTDGDASPPDDPLAHAGGPYYVRFGASLVLDGRRSAATGGASIAAYEWDLNNDGSFGDVTGATPAPIVVPTLDSIWGIAAGQTKRIRLQITDSAGATAVDETTVTVRPGVRLVAPLSEPTETVDTWNLSANWWPGLPTDQDGVVVEEGVWAQVMSTLTPTYSGGLWLERNATLRVGSASNIFPENLNALGLGTITLREGAALRLLHGSMAFPPIFLEGTAHFWMGESTLGRNSSKSFSGGVRGPGTLLAHGVNAADFTFDTANSEWTGGLRTVDETQPYAIRARADHCLGTGDVVIENNATLDIGGEVTDTIDDDATLTLNGSPGSGEGKLVLNADETVGALVIDRQAMVAGPYTRDDLSVIVGTGTLTVVRGL